MMIIAQIISIADHEITTDDIDFEQHILMMILNNFLFG